MPFGFNDNNDTKIDPQWAVDVLHKKVSLLNGSSADMKVNGSVTPVNFSFSPAANEVWYLSALSILLNDNGTNSPNKFGDLAALTNGLQIQVNSKSVALDIANMKDNIDLSTFFMSNRAVSGTTGVFESADVFIGAMLFQPEMILSGTSDYIRARVRDNLSTVDYLRITAHLWKVNP
jgi:hypothetical protein